MAHPEVDPLILDFDNGKISTYIRPILLVDPVCVDKSILSLQS